MEALTPTSLLSLYFCFRERDIDDNYNVLGPFAVQSVMGGFAPIIDLSLLATVIKNRTKQLAFF